MNNTISLGAWIIIGLFALMIIGLNLSLLAAWRNKDKNQPGLWQDIAGALRHPWQQEEQQLDELSRRAKEIKARAGQIPGESGKEKE
jgi:hypothetical protein